MKSKRIEIKNSVIAQTDGRPVLCDIHLAEPEQAPFVIFCHGFKGYKDWGSYPEVANFFASRGIHFLRFNFSHNGGTADQPIDFPDLKAFGQNTFDKELRDLQSVISYVKEYYGHRIGDCGIGLLAHSRGTATAVITASEDHRVEALCSWAGVSSIVDRLQCYPMEEWKARGVHYIRNGRTMQDMPLNYSLYEDYLLNQERYDLQQKCKALSCPHLVVHAEDDPVVPPSEAKLLEEWSPISSRFSLKEGGHTFGAAHPAKTDSMPMPLSAACEESIQFFKKHLSIG